MSERRRWRWFSEERDPLIKGLAVALVDLMDEGRDRAGCPFIVTQGVRDRATNEQVGGVADSAHLHGLAADLRVHSSAHLWRMVRGLLEAGARRLVIGVRIEGGRLVYHNLHVDIDLSKPSPVLAVQAYG